MTKKEYLTAIYNELSTPELKEYISKMMKKDEDELSLQIINILKENGELMSLNDLVKAINDETVSKPKISARLKKYVDAGTVEKETKVEIHPLTHARSEYVCYKYIAD